MDEDIASELGVLRLPALFFLRTSLAGQVTWPTKRAKRLLTDGPCPYRAHRPLDYAVAYGNLPVTQYLLAHGVNPSAFNGSTTLYMRCDSLPWIARTPPGETDGNRLQAYALTIAAGGDVNLWNAHGSALQVCRSLHFLRFLVAHGARPHQVHLESAIDSALTRYARAPEDAKEAFERIAFFTAFGLEPTSAFRRKLKAKNCGASESKGEVICTEIRRLFNVTPWRSD